MNQLYALLFFVFTTFTIYSQSFVTYGFSGGRFGDCIISYLHAKWLSYQYDLPLLYKPFDYSSQLCLDDREKPYFPRASHREMKLNRYQPFPNIYSKFFDCIYVCPYFAEDPSDRWLHPNGYRFDVDWKDEAFRKEVRAMIAPKNQLSLIIPSPSTVNIAIHIREGGGFDTNHTRLWDPLKLPPLPFYIEGLLQVIKEFPDRSIYCHLFTDAREPHLLAQEFEQAIPSNVSIFFGYRKEGNHHTAYVLEDFFSIPLFDVLIHPQSNYSLVSAFLYDFAITYAPYNFVRNQQQIAITETTVKKNEELMQNILERTKKL